VGQRHRDRSLAGERQASRQDLEQHDAERVHVAPLVDAVGVELLGGHVSGGAEDGAGARERRHVDARPPGEAEVEEADGAVPSDHHVVGLHVAVNDALRVGGGERLGQGGAERRRLLGRKGTTPPDRHLQVLAVHELGDEEEPAGALSPVADLEHRGVADPGQDLDLALEAADPVGVVPLHGAQDLERQRLAGREVGHAEHLAHAAAAEEGIDAVPACESLAYGHRGEARPARGWRGHGR
jgi:hypothetical protein